MSIWDKIKGRWQRAAQPIAAARMAPVFDRPDLTSPPLRVTQEMLEALARRTGTTSGARPPHPFSGLPKPPPGVIPANATLAMDDAIGQPQAEQFFSAWATASVWGEGQYFLGYPYLAELAQRPEYRHISETIAGLMTRKWIKLVSASDTESGALAEKIKKLDEAMKRYDLRGAFNKAMTLDGFMGMGMIYVDLTENPEEIKTPLLRDKVGKLTNAKIGKGSLRGFVVVDPTWVSPIVYNSTNPLKADFYRPSEWYVMGQRVNADRLLIVRSREVPDILKASYNFGGLSMSQMAKPYVDNWLRTRQSVSDLLHAFTVFVLKTNFNVLAADVSATMARIAAFVLGRDNKGVMLIDKESEELTNISAPLGSLDKLQAQAQEQMASVSQLTLVWLLGVTPSGLNASTDGEIRVQYDRIKILQEKVFGAILTDALEIIQLSEFGEIDPGIGYEFLPLWELDDAGRAAVEKTKADTDAVYMTEGVVTNDEVRDRLAADPLSPYHGLKGAAPEPPGMLDAGVNLDDDEADKIAGQGANGSESGANSGV